jgi:hypothetical protein
MLNPSLIPQCCADAEGVQGNTHRGPEFKLNQMTLFVACVHPQAERVCRSMAAHASPQHDQEFPSRKFGIDKTSAIV